MKRYAHRVDSNQADIVQALRQAGYTVQDLSAVGGGVPDLLVSGIDRETGRPANWVLETKTSVGKLNSRQRNWHARWPGPKAVVRTIDEALKAVGAI
jgi:hypothetical protein